MSKIYELKNASKIYKIDAEQTHAIDSIDLTINKGEIIVILGPSGSGKSTMLNILSGIDSLTKGKVIYNNIDLTKLNDNELTKYRLNNLGFIFQSYNLIANLTVRENVELGEHLSANALNIDEILGFVGLEDQKYKFPYQLSGGQMQRTAIARAVVKNPNVLFCDEPTGALDEEMGKQTLKLMQDINKKYGTTVIIVTHNPSIALMANTVIKMNSGKVVSINKNENVLDVNDIRWA